VKTDGIWRIFKGQFDSPYSISGVENLVFHEKLVYFLRDNAVYIRNENSFETSLLDSLEIPIQEIHFLKIAKFCIITSSTFFMLTTSGSIIYSPSYEKKIVMREFDAFEPVLDIKCSGYTLLFENKQGWFCTDGASGFFFCFLFYFF